MQVLCIIYVHTVEVINHAGVAAIVTDYVAVAGSRESCYTL
jgi:hypothetical protein